MPTFSPFDITFWLQCIWYIAAVFIAYYIPGSLVLVTFVLPRIFRIVLATVIGMVLFAYQGYVFGYLQVRYLTYVYIAICVGLWIYKGITKRHHPSVPRYSIRWKTWVIIAVGTLMQLSTIWFSGVTSGGSAYYCCGNPNDNFLYGTLSRQIIHQIPPQQPGMVGELFKNYHYWSNIVVGETSRIFGLPVFQVQFQYSTVFLSFAMGILFLCLVWALGGSDSLGHFVLFFFYFGSDAIYWIIILLRSAPMFSMSSLEDGVGFLANYPRAIAVVVAVAGMILLFLCRKKPSIVSIVIVSLLFASLAGFKIYIGFFVYIGLVALALYDLIRRKSWTTALVGIITLLFLLPIYIPANMKAGGLFYMGFWRAQNFIVQPWLNLLRLEQARIIYDADHKWMQVTFYNVLFTAIYFIAIFGTKSISLLNTKSSLKQIPIAAHVFFIPSMIVSLAIGFFFNQETGESNTFNFLVTVFIFLSLYAGLVLNNIFQMKKSLIGKIIVIVVIILTLPRPIYQGYKNIYEILNKKGFSISKEILDASREIRQKTNTDSIILVDPTVFKFDSEGPVFSMLTDRSMFFSGEKFLYWFRVPEGVIEERKQAVSTILAPANIIEAAAVLKRYPIDYLILGNSLSIISTTSASFVEKFYQNLQVTIYKIHRENIPNTVFNDAPESTTASEWRYEMMMNSYR
jgi:hypothetical protein